MNAFYLFTSVYYRNNLGRSLPSCSLLRGIRLWSDVVVILRLCVHFALDTGGCLLPLYLILSALCYFDYAVIDTTGTPHLFRQKSNCFFFRLYIYRYTTWRDEQSRLVFWFFFLPNSSHQWWWPPICYIYKLYIDDFFRILRTIARLCVMPQWSADESKLNQKVNR